MANRKVVSQTFADVQPLLEQTVFRFRNQPWADVEEMRSEAYESYLKAYQTYDPDRAAFSTWTVLLAQQAIRNLLRKKKRDAQLMGGRLSGQEVCKKTRFTVDGLMNELSADAAMVVKLTVQPPPDVKLRAIQGGGADRPTGIKSGIMEFLKDIGWSAARIAESFDEIRSALVE